MTRYFANHISNSSTMPDRPAGNTLTDAKRFADETFGDGFQDGELVIMDSETVGYVTVASKRVGASHWDNPA